MKTKDTGPIYKEDIHPALKDAFGYRLLHVALKYRRALIEILEEFDLAPPQLGILRILATSDMLTQALLGQELGHDKVTIVRMIDGLENLGFVNRIEGKKDKRQRLIQITKSGREVLAIVKKKNITREKNFLSPLSDSEAETLKKLIMKL
ncbi:MarR family transcriptional regulator [Bacteriovorax sp. PP10]|uniref:MarR family transcriptional regulator n=1 Tax=Bacteriovorax antarcticus TaxID=3088717 RepID=A0ABU5VT32_9BACT|nr:MarR family transcriptional regulator [Bacteriovorax sp. PP10]MEA9356082.1 MarR family transcriptional regulator [Bacteriovorax sp. PP10]